MKVTSIIFGSILMLGGLLLLVVGVSQAGYTRDGGYQRGQWSCTVSGTVQNCTFTSNETDSQTGDIAYGESILFAGLGGLISGSILFGAGAVAGRSRRVGYPLPPPYGPPTGQNPVQRAG